jgi:hypothetical protein
MEGFSADFAGLAHKETPAQADARAARNGSCRALFSQCAKALLPARVTGCPCWSEENA